jgi:hypothetical protein
MGHVRRSIELCGIQSEAGSANLCDLEIVFALRQGVLYLVQALLWNSALACRGCRRLQQLAIESDVILGLKVAQPQCFQFAAAKFRNYLTLSNNIAWATM